MADQQEPVFQIQRVYLKESSLEQPNSPSILLEQEQPVVDIQLGVDSKPIADGMYEVSVTATVHTKIKDRTVFLVEARQSGINCAVLDIAGHFLCANQEAFDFRIGSFRKVRPSIGVDGEAGTREQ